MKLGTYTIDVERALGDLGLEPKVWGADYVKVACPFGDHANDDMRPGLGVVLETGQWQCFKGCGGGSFEQLASMVLEYTPVEARRWLLVRGGEVEYGIDDCLLDSAEEVIEYEFEAMFRQDYARQSTERTHSYILDRGFTPATLKEWGIRYDERTPAIVLPLFDDTGEHLVGIIRREIPGYPLGNKYLVSPGCKKTRFLYGAWKHPRNTGVVIVVEGPLDVIWMHQLGFTSTVGIMGSSLSKDQEKSLLKLGQTVFVAVDNDDAGRNLDAQIGDKLGHKLNVVKIELPKGRKDVQEMPREELMRIFTKGGNLW